MLNRRLWVSTSPNSNVTLISSDKYGTGTTESYIQLIENSGIDFRSSADSGFNFRCASQSAMSVFSEGVTVKNLTTVNDINVGGKVIVNNNSFSANSTAKSLIKFTTRYDLTNNTNLYYYNLEIAKYYTTGQTINDKTYKVFNLTSWAEDGFSIINKCTVYISSEGTGIKYIMFYDNWGVYLPNGNQSGWQRDESTTHMTFLTTSQKKIITIFENLL